MDGFDTAIIGIAEVPGQGVLLAYSEEAILKTLVERDGMTEDDAEEYYTFNILGAYVGPGQPIIVCGMTPEDALGVLEEIETED
jgi:hypothetical protein